MRITGGSLRGRHLRVPSGDTVRPTQDRVREALFSSLQPLPEGVAFLDLFAGSGAVGLEAWSRGALRVCWVEENRRVFNTLQDNVKALCGTDSAVECRHQDALAFCRGWRGDHPFEVIFADPPYAGRHAGSGRAGMLLQVLGESGRLAAPGALLILEQGAGEPAPEADGWILRKERVYGHSCLRTYRHEGHTI